MTTVIDLRKRFRPKGDDILEWFCNPKHVYCGRPNVYRQKVVDDNGSIEYKCVPPKGSKCKWRNPFKVGKDGNLDTVYQKYRDYINNNDELKQQIHELRGKVLGCWCVGTHKCHAQILAELADAYEPNIGCVIISKQTFAIDSVKELKKSLAKELAKDDENADRSLDLLKRLDEVPVNIKILTETLIGTVVSKFKSNSNPEIASTARALVKKWKRQAKQETKGTSSSSSSVGIKAKNKPSPSQKKVSSTATTAASTSTTSPAAPPEAGDTSEWAHLPPHRKNMAAKFHQIFKTSESSLLETGLSADALSPLCQGRATEVEDAINVHSKGVKADYSTKIRSLIFNMKKNSNLREKVILGFTSVPALMRMTPAELATEEKSKEREETIQKAQDSLQLDWEEANEQKINEQCGITGELLKASLFTCGRCKSTKTTSTQKQTRSADEPMTVFVFCLNCGKRWKC